MVGEKIVYNACMPESGILSHLPRWPALSSNNTLSDPHLDLFKDRNSPDNLEAKTREQRDAPRVGRADACHKSLFPHAELVACVRKEQDERCVCAPLTAIRGFCMWK